MAKSATVAWRYPVWENIQTTAGDRLGEAPLHQGLRYLKPEIAVQPPVLSIM
jgi:hypothetical protein